MDFFVQPSVRDRRQDWPSPADPKSVWVGPGQRAVFTGWDENTGWDAARSRWSPVDLEAAQTRTPQRVC
ncbi:hypothetical protein [Schlesneria paludicola]|uniref:hypothetical protein n=1 Tax=Schlesneria paludicola TaxID=360056 RepID=UPI00031A58F0|nr:hypothetical protein [Schlesneria paludicola]